MRFDDSQDLNSKAIIKVVGVGGAGGSVINRLIQSDVRGVDYISINTDAQALRNNLAETRIQIGYKLTRGRGAGAKPYIGEESALENIDEIKEILEGSDMVFIAAGMGGGTGSGAAPIVAEIAKKLGCLTVAIVTKPYYFEGPDRRKNAHEALVKLKPHCDSLITISNDRLIEISDGKTTQIDAFKEADNILRQAVQGISETIRVNSLINVDFSDIRTVMEDKGKAIVGIGVGKGDNRLIKATRDAIYSRILESSIEGATDMIVNIASSEEIFILEINEAFKEIRNATGVDTNIIHAITMNNDLKDEVIITMIATGNDLQKNVYQDEQTTNFNLFEETKKENDKLTSFDDILKIRVTETNQNNQSSNINATKDDEDDDVSTLPSWL